VRGTERALFSLLKCLLNLKLTCPTQIMQFRLYRIKTLRYIKNKFYQYAANHLSLAVNAVYNSQNITTNHYGTLFAVFGLG
jgi:DNA-binding GntR family transcriptional regulator